MLVDATANQARKRRSVAGRQRQQQQQPQQESQQQIVQKETRIRARRRPGRVPPLDRSSISSTLVDASAGRRRGGEEVDRLLRQFPRNRLRIVEKLGEGSFGMVSQIVSG